MLAADSRVASDYRLMKKAVKIKYKEHKKPSFPLSYYRCSSETISIRIFLEPRLGWKTRAAAADAKRRRDHHVALSRVINHNRKQRKKNRTKSVINTSSSRPTRCYCWFFLHPQSAKTPAKSFWRRVGSYYINCFSYFITTLYLQLRLLSPVIYLYQR